MGIDYYAVNIYGKLFEDEDYDVLEEKYYYEFDIIAIGYDTHEEGVVVGTPANLVDQGEYEELKMLSEEQKKKVDTALGEGCKYYIIQVIN